MRRKKEEREKEREDPIVNDVDICRKTYGFLRETMNEFEADRITVLQFHNGGIYYSGRAIQKMSVSFEEAVNGISYAKEGRVNLPVSYYSDFLWSLLEEGDYLVPDLDREEAGHLSKLFVGGGTLSLICVPIWSLDNKLIGVLCLEFVRNKTASGELRAKVEALKSEASKLSGYIEEMGSSVE